MQTARKSFPKARKTFPSANRTPLLINMNKSDTTGLPSYNIDKNQIIPNQPGKEAEMTKSNSEISLLKSSPTNRDNSIQAAQKSILAEMKKRYTSPSKMYNPITATCVPSSTTDPEAGDDSYEEELVSLSVKLNATPQKTSFSSAEKIDATSTGKVEDVQLPHNTSLTQTSVQSPRPSDEKKLNVPDVHGVTHHPPTPAPTPLKEDDINVEAAMAALHGEPLDELIGVTSTGSAVKQSTDSKLEIHLEQSETEQKVDTESPVKEASSEVPIKQPTPSHEKEAVDPSANFDTSAPEAPSGVSVEKIEKTKIKRGQQIFF